MSLHDSPLQKQNQQLQDTSTPLRFFSRSINEPNKPTIKKELPHKLSPRTSHYSSQQLLNSQPTTSKSSNLLPTTSVLNQLQSEGPKKENFSQVVAQLGIQKITKIMIRQKQKYEEIQKSIFDKHLSYISQSQKVIEQFKRSFDSNQNATQLNRSFAKKINEKIQEGKETHFLNQTSYEKLNHSQQDNAETSFMNGIEQKKLKPLLEVDERDSKQSNSQKNNLLQRKKYLKGLKKLDCFNSISEKVKEESNNAQFLESCISPLSASKPISKSIPPQQQQQKKEMNQQMHRSQSNLTRLNLSINHKNGIKYDKHFQVPTDRSIVNNLLNNNINSHLPSSNHIEEDQKKSYRTVSLGRKGQVGNQFEDTYIGASIFSHVSDKFKFLKYQSVGSFLYFVKTATATEKSGEKETGSISINTPSTQIKINNNIPHISTFAKQPHGASKYFSNLNNNNSNNLMHSSINQSQYHQQSSIYSQKYTQHQKEAQQEDKSGPKRLLQGIVNNPTLFLGKQSSIEYDNNLEHGQFQFSPSHSQQNISSPYLQGKSGFHLALPFQLSSTSIAINIPKLNGSLQQQNLMKQPIQLNNLNLNASQTVIEHKNAKIQSNINKFRNTTKNIASNGNGNNNNAAGQHKFAITVSKRLNNFFLDDANLIIYEKFTTQCREFSKFIELLFKLEKNLNKNLTFLMKLIGSKKYLENEIVDLQFRIVHFSFIESIENQLVAENLLKTYFLNSLDLKSIIVDVYLKDLYYINGLFEVYLNAQQVAQATKISDIITAEFKMVKQKEKEVILDQLDSSQLKNLTQKKSYVFFKDYLYNIQPRRNTYKEIKDFEKNFGAFRNLSQIERDMFENLEKSYNQIRQSNNALQM